MTGIIAWEEPRPRNYGGRNERFGPIFKELREHPNQWALVERGAKSSTTGHSAVKATADIERTVRRNDGKWDIYMRAVKA